MNVLLGLVATLVITAITVTSMLLVRRRAPEGSYFTDGDRASGVFGVLATGFSVLLGFIIFLAFSSYDESRSGAEEEATIVAQQVQTAQFLPDVSAELTGELVCYARNVAGPEWDALAAGTLGDRINPWGAEMFLTISTVDPQTATEQSAYDRWMDQTSDREQARIARVHGAEGIIPLPLWLALFVISRRRLRLPALLRGPGGRAGHPSHADGERHGRHRAAPPAAGVLRPSARRRDRSAAADGDGADPAPDRHPDRGRRPRGVGSL